MVNIFQFQDGAIKGSLPNKDLMKKLNFNSKMVRLKAGAKNLAGSGSSGFQFQDGAIKGQVRQGK